MAVKEMHEATSGKPVGAVKIDGARDLATMERPRVVILGGGYAGAVLALRLARRSQAEIHLVNPRPRFTERIRLHQVAAGQALRMIELPHLLRGLGVRFHAARAEQIDPLARRVSLSNGDVLGYDRLVYALGSQIDFSVPGAREHALAVEDLDAAARMEQTLGRLAPDSRVVVVGGGLTATELVTELAERHPSLRWTMVTREAFAHGFAPDARDYFMAALQRRGIELVTGVTVAEVAREHVVTDQGDLPFDLCLWAGSFRGYALGREAGLAVNSRDQVLVDATLRSVSAPDIYVAGDSAALPSSYRPHVIMGCKTAVPQGIQVADNLLAELKGEAPQALRFAYPGTCVSLGRNDGLVQMLAPDGSPQSFFVTGRVAAWLKELICRSTVWTLYFERRFDFVDWLRPKRPLSPKSDETATGELAGVSRAA